MGMCPVKELSDIFKIDLSTEYELEQQKKKSAEEKIKKAEEEGEQVELP